MELKNCRKSVHYLLGCLFACSYYTTCSADKLCTVSPDPVFIPENSTIDILIAKINSSSDVTLTIIENPEDVFYLRGNELMAKKGLDYELLPSEDALLVWVRCHRTGSRSVNVSLEVFVDNVNDNPPNFAQSHYVLDVNELNPVNTSVGLIEATDVDSDLLYYRLESAMERYFRLENVNTPKLLVQNVMDYDNIQKILLVLHVQDTFNGSASSEPFFTSVTTITVNVKDIDNRPPWFQPCMRTNIGTAKLCVSTGYKGKVNLTEKEDGALALEPGPLYAKDGDRNRNEQISYRIIRGNEGNIFQIDEDTGNITMAKAADIAGPITLTVLASQLTNRDQFAVTMVTIEVMKKSRNPPRFEKERYDGYIYSNSVPESMILRDRTSNRPFRVKARDEDFASGTNPDVKYEVQYSSYVNVSTEGFVILKRVVKTESFALQLRALDVSTGEFGTAALSVQVIPAVAVPSPTGAGYRAGDMALLGLIMAALLVLCLIVIGFLISRLKKGNENMQKESECLGLWRWFRQPRGRHKDSMEFTNDGFQNDGGPRRSDLIDPRKNSARARGIPLGRRRPLCSTCGIYANHIAKGSPNNCLSGRGARGEDESGTRSILSKERRREVGQKTVWFKEHEDSSEIEVEVIPDHIGQAEEEAEKVEGDDGEAEEREGDHQTEYDGGPENKGDESGPNQEQEEADIAADVNKKDLND